LLSENPRIYPFRREHKASSDPLGAKSRSEVMSWARLKSVWLAQFNVLDLVLLAVGFALGRAEILGGIYPFAAAFVASSVLGYRHHSLLFLLASVLGIISGVGLGQAGWSYILSCIVLFIIFSTFTVDERKKWFIAPLGVLSVMVVLRGISNVFGGINNYELMVIFFEGLFACGMTIVMLVFWSSLNRFANNESLSADELVCVFVVLLGCISGLGEVTVYGFNLRDIASRALVMVAALWGGAGAGAGVGATIGIVPSLSLMLSPSVVGVYAFSGLLAGAFNSFGRLGVAMGFLLGNIMLALYMMSGESISMQLITTLIAAAILFLLPRGYLQKGRRIFGQVTLKSSGEEKGERLLKLSNRRLRNTAWIFRDLAQNCRSMVNTMPKDEKNNINMVLEHLSQRVCRGCAVRQVCWKIDAENTCASVLELFRQAENSGAAEVKDAPEAFARRCPHLRELVASVNCLYELYCRSNYWQEQKTGSQLFLASQLEGTAQVLENLASDLGSQGRERDAMELDLTRVLNQRGLCTDGVHIYHCGEKAVSLWVNFSACPGEDICRATVEREVSRLLRRPFEVHECCCAALSGERCRYQLLAAGARHLSIGRAQLAKGGHGLCGDSDGTLSLSEGRQLLMLSDGMGVGAKASLQSGSAIKMLSRLLEVGFDKDTAIDTVNTILLLQGKEESFVTLDMCIIDLYQGEAEFIKTGGAPSFIKRGRQVQVVKSNSLPVGMLQSVDKAMVTAPLGEGDMIVMASDGLLDADCQMDTRWLTSVLAQSNCKDAQAMAEYLLGKAIDISGGRLKDDITILVAQMSA